MTGLPQESREHCLFTLTGQIPPGLPAFQVISLPIFSIISTRPKPAYGRQGLAGSWGQDTYEVSTFLVFLTSHFAPAALSSDLTNLGL